MEQTDKETDRKPTSGRTGNSRNAAY